MAMTASPFCNTVGLLVSLLLVPASYGAAQEPAPELPVEPCAAERFVVLRASPLLDGALMDEVRTDLAAELEQRGLAVCPEETARAPAVVVDVHPANGVLVIELDDRVTAKRVARDLSLAKIPENGRALAVAIAIDELLRASWAELELAPRPTETISEPSQEELLPRTETRTVNARGSVSPREHERSRFDLALALGYLGAKDDFDALTARLQATTYPFGMGWAELRVGGIQSVPAEAERGAVSARGFSAQVALGACTPRESVVVFGCVGALAGFDWLVFRGLRPENARAQRGGAAVVQLGGLGRVGLNLSRRLYVLADLSLGAAALGARATDGQRTLVGVSGLLLGAQLGLGVRR